jgi:ubiquinol-cytochrome c reductase iron-sulfur subunit
VVAVIALLGGLRRRHRAEPSEAGEERRVDGGGERIVPAGTPSRGAENLVLALLAVAILFALGFVVVYAEYSAARIPNELLGICLGGAFLFVAAALTVVARRLVVSEELEDDYPHEHPKDQREVAEIIHQSGSRITRKRLLLGAGTAAGGALGLAALTPVASLGPLWYTTPLDQTPWRRGTRLVDETGRPYSSAAIEQGSFYTAFPEGADPEAIGSSIVVVRVDPATLRLPAERAAWAPGGIVAYSKICTHAGCAIALYRKPTFPVLEPAPALVCPCHYSTFNPALGGAVTYGPAGRALPQLPLLVDGSGILRAGGNFSGPVGPSWWGARDHRAD